MKALRNAVFGLMIITFISLFFSLGPQFDIPCYILGVEGIVLFLLTLKQGERRWQKTFMLLAGGAGAGFLFTLGTFQILSRLGLQPGGDGGGPTVALLIIVFPALFLIGAIGSIVCLIRGNKSAAPPAAQA